LASGRIKTFLTDTLEKSLKEASAFKIQTTSAVELFFWGEEEAAKDEERSATFYGTRRSRSPTGWGRSSGSISGGFENGINKTPITFLVMKWEKIPQKKQFVSWVMA
jgi:hypothetical protein